MSVHSEPHIEKGNTPHPECPACDGTGKEVIGITLAEDGHSGTFEFRRCQTCMNLQPDTKGAEQMTKPIIGDRVQLNAHGLAMFPKRKSLGTVVGVTQRDGYKIKWDDLKTVDAWSPLLLTVKTRNPAEAMNPKETA